MPWAWDEIVRNWLEGGIVAPTPAQIVDSFETAERLLGRNWIDAQRFQSGVVVTGTAPTLAMVSMGQRLRVIENRPGTQELIERGTDCGSCLPGGTDCYLPCL